MRTLSVVPSPLLCPLIQVKSNVLSANAEKFLSSSLGKVSTDVPAAIAQAIPRASEVRFRGQTGKHFLIVSLTTSDHSGFQAQELLLERQNTVHDVGSRRRP